MNFNEILYTALS